MSELSQAIQEMRNMRETYDALATQNAQLVADLQAIKDAHILGFSLDGLVFAGGYEPVSAFELIVNMHEILEVHDNKTDTVPNSFSGLPQLEVLELSAATVANVGNTWLNGNNVIKEIILPHIYIHYSAGFYMVNACQRLRKLNMLYGGIDIVQPLANCENLIDVITGVAFADTNNNLRTNFLEHWDPINALDANSTSLLTQEDIDAGFTSNLEKLLYNIREHIAANLKDLTGESSLSVKFSANIKAAIQADTATSDAFTNKNWTIV